MLPSPSVPKVVHPGARATDFPYRKLNSVAGVTLSGRSDRENASSNQRFRHRLVTALVARGATLGDGCSTAPNDSARMRALIQKVMGRRSTGRAGTSIHFHSPSERNNSCSAAEPFSPSASRCVDRSKVSPTDSGGLSVSGESCVNAFTRRRSNTLLQG
jgi:hypothetical protein